MADQPIDFSVTRARKSPPSEARWLVGSLPQGGVRLARPADFDTSYLRFLNPIHAALKAAVDRFEPVSEARGLARPGEPLPIRDVVKGEVGRCRRWGEELLGEPLGLGTWLDQAAKDHFGFPWGLPNSFVLGTGRRGDRKLPRYEVLTLPNGVHVYAEFDRAVDARIVAASATWPPDFSDRLFADALCASNGAWFGTDVILSTPDYLECGLDISEGRLVDLVLDLFAAAERQQRFHWDDLLNCRASAAASRRAGAGAAASSEFAHDFGVDGAALDWSSPEQCRVAVESFLAGDPPSQSRRGSEGM